MTFLSNFRRAAEWLAPARRFLTLALALSAVGAQAQAGVQPLTVDSPEATRAELTMRLDSLRRVDASSGSVVQRRERAAEVTALSARLAEGDFQVGDRFLVDDGAKRDTIVVRDSMSFSLLNWPSYPLRGVLRAELQGAVERYVGTYVREPRIRIFPLTRLAFTGGVARPGFLFVDPTRPLSDALMVAGGTGQTGKADEITVYRGNSRLMNTKRVSDALRDGATIDDLGLRSGDEIRVPVVKPPSRGLPPVQMLIFGISAIGAILALIRASYVP